MDCTSTYFIKVTEWVYCFWLGYVYINIDITWPIIPRGSKLAQRQNVKFTNLSITNINIFTDFVFFFVNFRHWSTKWYPSFLWHMDLFADKYFSAMDWWHLWYTLSILLYLFYKHESGLKWDCFFWAYSFRILIFVNLLIVKQLIELFYIQKAIL